VIKLVALVAAYRLLRPLVTIVIVATLAVLLLSGTRATAGHGSHAVAPLQHAAARLEQFLQRTLQKAIAP
jgi:hypothetical protein